MSPQRFLPASRPDAVPLLFRFQQCNEVRSCCEVVGQIAGVVTLNWFYPCMSFFFLVEGGLYQVSRFNNNIKKIPLDKKKQKQTNLILTKKMLVRAFKFE